MAWDTLGSTKWPPYGFAFVGLFLGADFLAHAIKHYVSTAPPAELEVGV
jgi:hypothetical protein